MFGIFFKDKDTSFDNEYGIIPSISGGLGGESLNRGVQYIYNESQKGSE
ncbi:hypothetical protein [Haemophilus haemolyticus]|nr:hypothetical protein [Haemophilus haemolyticus]